MIYNDHILFIDDKKLSQMGRFIAYRPDKQTVVLDKNGLKEFPEDRTHKATHEEICNYYGSIIAACNKTIQCDEKMIVQLGHNIYNLTGTLKNRVEAIEQLEIEDEKIFTCLTIAGVDIRRDCDDGFTELKNDLREIRSLIRHRKLEIKTLTRKAELRNTEILTRTESIEENKIRLAKAEAIRDEYLKGYREAKKRNELPI